MTCSCGQRVEAGATTCPRCRKLLDSQATIAPPLEAGDEPPEVREARRDPKRRLDRFLILSELGRGGMGVVYRAWDEKLRRAVALKTLLKADPGAVLRFQREAEITAKLKHPGIVALHDAGEHSGKPWIAVELVDGESFEERLAATPRISLTRALEVVRDAARAVDHAHSQGVVHRDLKPANVLVDGRGAARVLDFGVAKREDERAPLTKTGAVVGTLSFMAPEQLDGRAVDRRCDVYALGAILYQVLAGTPPFSGAPYEVAYALVAKDPVPPGAINRRARGDLETICLKALEKDPERRYATAGALADDIDRYLAGDPVEARPLGGAARSWRWARRNKLATAGAFLAVGSLGALAGSAAWLAGADARMRLADARLGAESAAAEFARERDARGDDRERGDRVAGLGFAALGAAVRLAALDPRERPRAFETAAAVGSEALGLEQWGLARTAFLAARDLGVDGTRAAALLASVETARTRVQEEHRTTVDALLAEARLDPTARQNDWHTRALFALVRIGDAATIERLAKTVDAARAKVERGKGLELGEQAAALLACEALGWIGVRERAAESLGRLLDAEPAKDEASEDRAIAAGMALCRIGEGARVEGALSRFPTSGRIWRQVGHVLPKESSAQEAATAGELGRRARVRQSKGDLDGAIADFARIVELDPRLASSWSNCGCARHAKGDLTGAIADYTKALELDPRCVFAWSNRGWARQTKGDLDGAIEDATKAIELDRSCVSAWTHRADARRAKGDLDGAIEDATKAIELNAREAVAWNNRGLAWRAKRQLDRAIADFDKALEIDPLYVAAWTNRGDALRIKDPDRALADCTKALELDSRHVAAWNSRAGARHAKGDVDGAIADCTRALELDPRHLASLRNRGFLLQKKGDFDGSIVDLGKARDMEPRHAATWWHLGVSRERKGDVDGAIEDLTKALELDPGLAEAWMSRAHARKGKRDLAGAASDLGRFLELAPNDPRAPSIRAEIEKLSR